MRHIQSWEVCCLVWENIILKASMNVNNCLRHYSLWAVVSLRPHPIPHPLHQHSLCERPPSSPLARNRHLADCPLRKRAFKKKEGRRGGQRRERVHGNT